MVFDHTGQVIRFTRTPKCSGSYTITVNSIARKYQCQLHLISVSFTMDVYSHIIEEMQSDAMVLLDEVLPTGVSQKKWRQFNASFRHYVQQVISFSITGV